MGKNGKLEKLFPLLVVSEFFLLLFFCTNNIIYVDTLYNVILYYEKNTDRCCFFFLFIVSCSVQIRYSYKNWQSCAELLLSNRSMYEIRIDMFFCSLQKCIQREHFLFLLYDNLTIKIFPWNSTEKCCVVNVALYTSTVNANTTSGGCKSYIKCSWHRQMLNF